MNPIEANKIIFVISLVAVPIALIKLCIALYEWYVDRRLLRTGIETTGTVVDECRYDPSGEEVSDDPSYYSRFFAEYEVGTGKYRVLSRFHGKRHALLNERYVIVYDPEKPGRARFKRDDTLIWPVRINVIALVIALGVFIYGLLTLDL
jgi:hypothetical protein